MDNPIEDQVTEPSASYRLTVMDDEYVSVNQHIIFDEKHNKGIHSLKFNHNNNYLAAGIV